MRVYKEMASTHSGKLERVLQCDIPLQLTEADKNLFSYNSADMSFFQPLGSYTIHDALGMPLDCLGLATVVGHLRHEAPVFTIEVGIDEDDGLGLLPYEYFDVEFTPEELFILMRCVMLGMMAQMDEYQGCIELQKTFGAVIAGMEMDEFCEAMAAEAYRAAGYGTGYRLQ